MTISLMFIHFENDNTYFAGSILHHSETSRWTERDNSSIANIPQGFLMTYCCNIIWLMLSVKIIFYCDPMKILNEKNYSVTASQIFLSATFFKFHDRHTKLHEVSHPDGINALPFSMKYRAYKHVCADT